MTRTKKCSVAGCEQEAAASLEGQALCREHFISLSFTRLDQYDEIRKGPGLRGTDTESVRRFIHESARHADEIEHQARDLDNLDRAKLLNIILLSAELGRHLRRSPRKAASIPVRLCSDKLGSAWEEDAETVLLSQYGASVRCRHAAKPGETLEIVRSDTGAKAQARVAWQRAAGNDDIRIGVEFVSCENFWELDWGAVEEAR
jgi:PilZ domain